MGFTNDHNSNKQALDETDGDCTQAVLILFPTITIIVTYKLIIVIFDALII